MSLELNKDFWNDRYINSETGWDTGDITTPLKEYFDQLKDKTLRILVPGCGNAYEAEYLFNNGFNTTVVDYSKKALCNFKRRVPDFPKSQLLNTDFFNIQGEFDLIIEQTFFCAIYKHQRNDYAHKMSELLSANGKLVGLLFDDVLNEDHPPYGGSKKEYIECFKPYFNFTIFDTAYNSIKPRMGREIFMIIQKK